MDQEQKEKIVKELQKKVKSPCPRCEAKEFEVVGQTLIPLNDNPREFQLGGPAIPAAVVACSNCGFLTLHALGALKLMPQDADKMVQSK